MGCLGFWRFMAAKKRYVPALRKPRNQRQALGGPDSKFRVDMQGSLFSTIRYAYSSCNNLDAAQALVLKKLEKVIMDKTAAVLYFDGAQCEEKLATQQQRQKARAKAIDAAETHVTTFMDRVTEGAHIRKRHFTNVKKQLTNAFRWDSEARNGLVLFLRNCGWTVVQCETEADVRIAAETVEGDIVISGDSDLFIYERITVVWRPLRGDGFLEYQKKAVLSALGLESTAQLAVLGIVSTNDYNHSIYGLGCETNYKIVKEINTEGLDGQGKHHHELFERDLSAF